MPALVDLLDAGVPIPYLARYRRDRVGGASEERLREIRARFNELTILETRRAEVLRALEEAGMLTEDLRSRVDRTRTLPALEDFRVILQPAEEFRVAEGKLGPLASAIERGDAGATLADLAAPFISPEEGVPDLEKALNGVQSILAFRWSRDVEARRRARRLYQTTARIAARVLPEMDPQKKYETYKEFSQPVRGVPGHRVLAILRGEAEKALEVKLTVEREKGLEALAELFVARPDHPFLDVLKVAVERAWDRHLAPDMDKETRATLKHRADEEAVRVFARNLGQMMLAPPAGPKVVMGVEPGIRRGVKIAVVDETGKYLKHATIHPFAPSEKEDVEKKKEAARKTVGDFCRAHKVDYIGVGSGPGCREVDRFLRDAIKADAGIAAKVVMVNEAGSASYATGAVAEAEFPKFDPRVRAAITIARRLRDPLSELTRMELKSLGVGPYQRDVDQELLGSTLREVAQSCVSRVGVDVNGAEAHVLALVPGLDIEKARVIRERAQKEKIRSRAELKTLPGIDDATFAQCAGFVRVFDGENPLDGTTIHPELYGIVESMAGKLGIEVKELFGNEKALASLDPAGFVADTVSLETINGVFATLRDGVKDPRGVFEPPAFRDDLKKLEDLKEGMVLEGVITNLASFGVFVDVGVDQEGLVHVSEISDEFVGDPVDHVSLGQKVKVRVLGVDLTRRRLSLSCRSPGPRKPRRTEEGRRPPRARRPGEGGDARRPRPAPVDGVAPAPAPDDATARRDRKRREEKRPEGEGARREADRRRRRDRPGSDDRSREGHDLDRDSRRGSRRGHEEDSEDRRPRVIEQLAKRETEPEIDPNLPEEEKFRLKLERLRQKFEKGR